VIATLNEKFVSTWIIIDDIKRRLGGQQDALANTLLYLHQYPFDFMFLTPEGKFVTRLTSFQDLPAAHPAVSHPRRDGHESHADIFLETVAKHFGTD
jgi:hypothetical protein